MTKPFEEMLERIQEAIDAPSDIVEHSYAARHSRFFVDDLRWLLTVARAAKALNARDVTLAVDSCTQEDADAVDALDAAIRGKEWKSDRGLT